MTTPTPPLSTSNDGPFSHAPVAAGMPQLGRWGRIAITVVLALMARHAFADEYGYIPLIGDVDTAIHEFGHYLFMPFGRMMMILGGSLFQVVFPLIFMGYFLRPSKRDVHAATVCLWWVSINLLGVAIYMADSRAGKLMLLNGLTGQDSDAHDWWNLFTMWGRLSQDTIIAARVRGVAVLACLASIILGLWTAWFNDAPAAMFVAPFPDPEERR
jgi:hypothetical protein